MNGTHGSGHNLAVADLPSQAGLGKHERTLGRSTDQNFFGGCRSDRLELPAMSSGPSGTLTAYVDEAGGRLANGQLTYAIAGMLAQLPLHGAIVVTTVTDYTFSGTRSRAAADLLAAALEHIEYAGRVVLESRARSDKHDVRTP